MSTDAIDLTVDERSIMQKDSSEETVVTSSPGSSDDSSNLEDVINPYERASVDGDGVGAVRDPDAPLAIDLNVTENAPLQLRGRDPPVAIDPEVTKNASVQQRRRAAAETEIALRSESNVEDSRVCSDCNDPETGVAAVVKVSPFGVSAEKEDDQAKKRAETESTVEAGDEDSQAGDTQDGEKKKAPQNFAQKWTERVLTIAYPIKLVLLALAGLAARNPKAYVIGIVCLSISLAVTGLKTNFYMEVDENALWKPMGSLSESHGEWVETGPFRGPDFWATYTPPPGPEVFPGAEWRGKQFVTALVHANGENVVTHEGASRLFESMDTVKNTTNYNEYCQRWGTSRACPKGYDFACAVYEVPYLTEDGDPLKGCEIRGPTQMWFHDTKIFNARAKTDADVQEALTVDITPGKFGRFKLKNIIAYPRNNTNGTLVSGVSYMTVYVFDAGYGARIVTREATNRLLDLRDKWEADENNAFTLELFASTSFPDEFNRGIVKDIPLVPLVFVVMSIFTMFVFSKRDWVNSRALLGFGAVACVSLSIMSGYGLLFIIGVPFTSLTQILPFIMFGIGLDDAFIIINAYDRTDPNTDAVDRVHKTIDEVGMSIFMTTATSVLAFSLGCTTTLPAIQWLCLYAFPTIFIDFVYQITFFVALIVIDERRIKNRRRDCFVCYAVKGKTEGVQDEWLEDRPRRTIAAEESREKNWAESVMIWYADRLLRRKVKAAVLWFFTSLFVLLAYSASQLKVQFDFTSVLPSDSYVKNFNQGVDDYAQTPNFEPVIYFRNVDQSDPAIQAQMDAYVEDLTSIDAITEAPFSYWLSDYKSFISVNSTKYSGLPFNETLELFLSVPEYKELHNNNIVRDDDGNIVTSRVRTEMDNLEPDNADSLLGALRQQRSVGRKTPINQKGGEWSFFLFDTVFFLWEFLHVTAGELRMATILGISAVSFMGMIFMPHWSGVLFTAPMISILYIDLLGFLQLFGVTINGVSFVAIVMSIGLLVDFIMHIQLSYYESTKLHRYYKVKDVLHTMGASVLLGGVSTFLGVLPLAFAANDIFYTIFITFMGIVTLGISHGLILLPVLLSIFGPH